MDAKDLLNQIPGETRWGNWVFQSNSYGEITRKTVDAPNGGNAQVTIQPVVRPSGMQKWIATVSYNGKNSTIVSEKDQGDAFMRAMKDAGAA